MVWEWGGEDLCDEVWWLVKDVEEILGKRRFDDLFWVGDFGNKMRW